MNQDILNYIPEPEFREKFDELKSELQQIINSGFLENLKKFNGILKKLKRFPKLKDYPVYLTTFKRPNGDKVIMAKSNWIDEDGNKKGLGIYVGKLLDFEKGLNDQKAKKIGEEKMRKKIYSLL